MVYSLLFDGTNLYAGGHFSLAGGVAASNIAKWDGNGLEVPLGPVRVRMSLTSLGRINLYAGGSDGVAKWNGNAWSPLGSGVNASVSALFWDGPTYTPGAHSPRRGGGGSQNRQMGWDGLECRRDGHE